MRRATATTILVTAALLGAATSASATYPGDNGRIAYANFITGEIESVKADGTGRLKLTHLKRGSFAGSPSFAPDGQTILFEKHKPTSTADVSAIWETSVDGDDPHKIAGHGKFRYYTPQYNDDGTRIAFTRCQPGDGVCAIWDMAADGSDERALTPYVHDDTNEAVDFHPIYSPDGNTIVFDRYFSDGEISRLFTMEADGDDEGPLTPPALEAFGADWSPDGNSIVFATHLARTGSNVWSIEPDGDNPQEVATDIYPANNFAPSYSPEGDQIVFATDRAYDDFCCIDLFLMPDTGGAGTKLEGTGPPGAVEPAWGPAIP
jgi:Tol biopolymer transport system component